MDKNNKKTDTKQYEEKHSRKYKVKVFLTAFLCLFLILVTAVYILYIVTHKDKNRDNNTYNDNANTSLIEKNVVDAFKDTEMTGKISFNIPTTDVNQMLHNASTHILNEKVKSMYYESDGEHHYFCFDLKPKLFVKTRVVVDTVIEGFTEDFDMVLGISKVKMGKLSYLNKDKFLNQSFFEEVSKYSSLPISYNGDIKKIVVSPPKLFDCFPSGELFDVIKELVNGNPQIMTPSINSLFGFNIDLSSFRKTGIRHESSNVDVINLEERVTSNVTQDLLDTLSAGESKIACSFTVDEFNAYLRLNKPTLVKSEYLNGLTDNVISIETKDLYASFLADQIQYTLVIDINGYEIDFDIDTSSALSGVKFKFNILHDVVSKSGSVSFNKESSTYGALSSYLFDTLTKLGESYSFFTFNNANKLFSIDFGYVVNSFEPFYSFELKLNSVSQTFDFVVTKLIS